MTTWLIVEDEPSVYEMLVAMSEVLGSDGLAFVDGEAAAAWIEEVERGEFRGELPELALLDIRLPGKISGPMVGARLRQSARLGRTGVVLLTAYHMSEEDRQEAIAEAGADLFLTKPLPSLAELRTILQAVVAKRAAAQP